MAVTMPKPTIVTLKEMRDEAEAMSGDRGPYCLVGSEATLGEVVARVASEAGLPTIDERLGDWSSVGLLPTPSSDLIPDGEVKVIPLSRLIPWVVEAVRYHDDVRRRYLNWR